MYHEWTVDSPVLWVDSGQSCIMSGQWTDLVMAIRILDKDITQRYWILQRSLGCPSDWYQRRKGWGNDLRNSDGLAWILEQVLYLFEGTYSIYFYRYSWGEMLMDLEKIVQNKLMIFVLLFLFFPFFYFNFLILLLFF